MQWRSACGVLLAAGVSLGAGEEPAPPPEAAPPDAGSVYVTVGDPGNPPDPTPPDPMGTTGFCRHATDVLCRGPNDCPDAPRDREACVRYGWPEAYAERGSVPYVFAMRKYPVSVAEWAAYLNATGRAADPRALAPWQPPHARSEHGHPQLLSGEPRHYRALAPELPWPYANRSAALRFANWKATGDPARGAYACDAEGCAPPRLAGARIALPTLDEWRKAAGWDAGKRRWWEYPGKLGAAPEPGVDAAVAWAPGFGRWGNCSRERPAYAKAPCRLVPIGSFPHYASPWGVEELCGNGIEITESPGELRGALDPDRMIVAGTHPWLTALDCRNTRLQQGPADATYFSTKVRLIRLP